MEFDFNDLTPFSAPVKISGREYVLREADGEAAIAYRDASVRAAKFTDGKLSGADGLAAAEAMLVSRCLFPVGDGGKVAETPVTERFVRSLPNRVFKRLYEKVKEVSDIGTDDGTDPKDQALADALAHPDSPATYEAVRDHVRRILPTDPRYRPLAFMLEDKEALLKN